MQHQLAVAEEDALRQTGRTGGIEDRGLCVLVEIGKIEVAAGHFQ
jgi:hypothetical protein